MSRRRSWLGSAGMALTLDPLAAQMIETYVRRWLSETELGRGALAQLDGNIEAAIDAVFESMNAGFIKVASSGGCFTHLEFINPPRPPLGRIERPRKH